MKILITGSKGMLGTDLMQCLGMQHDVTGSDISDLDITDLEATLQFITRLRPELVIHSAAMTNVDACESQQDDAYRINAIGTRNIAVACQQIDAALLYISTDYVFNGHTKCSWVEDDDTQPINIYGKSKLAGESYVQTLLNRWYIVRTQWLYGLNGKNFVHTMLKIAQERDEVSVVNDQFGCPTYTVDLARAIAQLIETPAYGIYHLTNTGITSWFEFTKAIYEVAGFEHMKVLPATTEEINRPASRPGYSPMENRNWRLNGFEPLKHYREALQEYILSELAEN